jgi:two-component system, response regulator PdtaR
MKRLRILVVEDDGMVAFLLGQILEGMGHEACGIESNKAGAIAAAKRLQPDLMIVDEHLGPESGLAVIEAVLQDGPMPHVFVSGDTTRIRSLKPLAIVLEKPYFEPDLEQAIGRALAQPVAASHLAPIEPPAKGPVLARPADSRRA